MKLAAIVAMSQNRVIGQNNTLPWHLPADLKHFKEVTMGKPIIMGRKTFDSIGRALPGRTNIIITRNTDFHAEGCLVVHSIDEALNQCRNSEEAMIIGGAELFIATMPKVQRIYLTIIHEDFVGDVFFPKLDDNEWKEESREDFQPDAKNPYPYSFLTLQRI